MILAEAYSELEAKSSGFKELKLIEELLGNGKYKQVPYGWHLFSQYLFAKLESVYKMKFSQNLKESLEVAIAFTKETGYEGATLMISIMIGQLKLDKSKEKEYLAFVKN